MSDVSVNIEGFPELLKKIQELSDDRSKRREILGILKQVASGTVSAAKRNAPIAKRQHIISGKRARRLVKPGNLKKSMGTIVGRKGASAVNPTVYVGPRTKGMNDGFYGNFVEAGHAIYKGRSRNSRKGATNATGSVRGQFFMKRTYDQTKGQATQESEVKIAKYIQRKINQLSR